MSEHSSPPPHAAGPIAAGEEDSGRRAECARARAGRARRTSGTVGYGGTPLDRQPSGPDASMIISVPPALDRGPIHVLLIEDDCDQARLIGDALAGTATLRSGDPGFRLERADRVSTGLAHLLEAGADVVLLELSLLDGSGLETLVRVRQHAPDVPIVVLTSMDDEALALQAIQAGAQDYLIKDRVNRDLLVRAIRYARERHRAQRALSDLARIDPLTGLNNRRGFLDRCEQCVTLTRTPGRELVLFLIDIDDMKHINDTCGHQAGDRALLETASILRSTFRRSDIITRLGGDEFAVLSVDLPLTAADLLLARLRATVDRHNHTRKLGYRLSLSVGIAVADGTSPPRVEDLLARADGALYAEKRGKQAALLVS